MQPLRDFTQDDIEFFKLQKVPNPVPDGSTEKPDHLMFEFQKSTRNGAFIRESIKERVEVLKDNYNCKNWQKMTSVIDNLLELMKINVQHGNFECAVLNLGGNKETKCLLNSIRLEMSSITNLIHESIDQLKLINNDLIPPGNDVQEKLEKISDNIQELRDNCDMEPEIKNVGQFKAGVMEIRDFDDTHAVYKNNATRDPKKFPRSLQHLKNHIKENLIIEAERITLGCPPLTGIFGV